MAATSENDPHTAVGLVRDPAPRPVPDSVLRHALIASDMAAVCAAWLSVLALMSTADDALATLARWSIAATFISLATLHREQLYLPRVWAIRAVEVQHAGRAGIVSAAAVLLIDAVVGGPLTLTAVAIATAVAGLLLVWSRAAVEAWAEGYGDGAVRHRALLLTGSMDVGARVIDALRARPELGIQIAGLVSPDRPSPALSVPWVGTLADLPVLLKLTAATGVTVVGGTLDAVQTTRVLTAVQSLDVSADLVTLDANGSPQFRVLPPSRRSAARGAGGAGTEPTLSGTQRVGKRAFDLVAGGALAILALPLVLAAAALLRLTTGGPAFTQDVELGPRAEPVTLRRLRTRQLPDAKAARWIMAMCRRLCIDELPQLGNVLAGSMTLVGPRPRPPGHAVAAVDMSAGLIGLRHIERGDHPAFGAHRRTDEFYIENWSVGLDLSIIAASASDVAWRTVRDAMRGQETATV